MNAFFKRAGAVLGRIWAWSLLLVLSIALAVWFFGPLLAVEDHRLWQDLAARLLTISALFLLWGAAMVLANWRSTVRARKAESGEVRQRRELVEHELKHLRERFKAALRVLESARRHGKHGGRGARRLPWYLVIGQEGSGKTCMLTSGGLQSAHPPNEMDPGAGNEGAGSCDWYFNEDGVLIDTAGRYLSQPDNAVDGRGWSTLLGLLKRRCRVRPLNGVVVTLSLNVLLTGSEHERDLHARQIHSRLLDIQQGLCMDLPLYLLVTQADRLPGFTEFCGAPPVEGGDGILGQYLAPGQGTTEIGQVRQGFEALLQRLNGELVPRLHHERNGERRGRLLDFPRQLGGVGERLCRFIEAAFCTPGFQRVNRLHGIYFNSVLGSTHGLESRLPFFQAVFARVIAADPDLARLDKQEQRRIYWRQAWLTLMVLWGVGTAGLVWMHSYGANVQRLEQLHELARQPVAVPPGSSAVLAMLPLLDSRLAATRVFPSAEHVSRVERMGLYQGDISRPILELAYTQALGRLLQSRVSELLEEQVRASLDDRERLLDTLRAYLMLNLPARRDPAWLVERVAGHWRQRFAGDPSVLKRLNDHFARLLEQPFVQPLDDELVAQAREVLRGESLADVVYRVLREQARSLEPYRLAQGLVSDEAQHVIPGFYTKRYLRYFEGQGERLVNAIVQDNWVLGEGTDLSAGDLQQLIQELEQRYFSEYAETWSEALGNISLRTAEDTAQGAAQLAVLASVQSPLLQLLQQIWDNTRLVPVLEGEVATPEKSARLALQSRFELLHGLLDAQQGPGEELGQALLALNELHLQWAIQNTRHAPEQAAFELVKRRMQGQEETLRGAASNLPAPLNGWLEGLADDHWHRLLDDAYRHVNLRYQSDVYGVYKKTIRQRYPFNPQADSDVALDDFHEFFKPRGVLERFFNNYLQPFVSVEGGRYVLRRLDERSLPISRALLDQQARIQSIRRGFYGTDPVQLGLNFTLAPNSLDEAVSRAVLSVGGQRMEYRHGPIVPLEFRWPGSVETGSSLVLERHAQQPLRLQSSAGAWSLFRLIDQMQSEPGNASNELILRGGSAGLEASYLLTGPDMPGPFQMQAWRTFRLPEQL